MLLKLPFDQLSISDYFQSFVPDIQLVVLRIHSVIQVIFSISCVWHSISCMFDSISCKVTISISSVLYSVSCTCDFFDLSCVWYSISTVFWFIQSVVYVTFSISCVWYLISCRCYFYNQLCLIFDQLCFIQSVVHDFSQSVLFAVQPVVCFQSFVHAIFAISCVSFSISCMFCSISCTCDFFDQLYNMLLFRSVVFDIRSVACFMQSVVHVTFLISCVSFNQWYMSHFWSVVFDTYLLKQGMT